MKIAGNGVGDTMWKVPGVLDWATMTHNPFVDVTKDTTTLYASDRDVFLFLVDDTHPIEAGRLPNGDPDLYFRGFYCWNSEVGSKTLGIASASTIRNRSATSRPYLLSMSSLRKSANSAQSSTPVGPPPTTTTVSSASTTWLHSPQAIAAAALSKLLRRRAWSFALSSASLRKSAFSCTPGMPKVLGCAPTAMTSLS